MKNEEIIKTLRYIGKLLELKGENPFKARAYFNAADIFESQGIDIKKELKENTLKNIKGIGKALVEKIEELAETGKLQYLEKLKEEIPDTLPELTKISGLGVKKVKFLYENYGISSLESLEEAADSGELEKIKGFGKKSVEEITQGIHFLKAHRGKFLQEKVKNEADNVLKILKELPEIKAVQLSGAMRRVAETIEDILIIASADDIDKARAKTLSILEGATAGNDIAKIKSAYNIKIEILFKKPEEFYPALHYTTGNKEYLTKLKSLASDKGFTIEEAQIKKEGSGPILFKSEKEIYSMMDFSYMQPELRESAEAAVASSRNQAPALVEDSDLKGMIHLHSTWSDGKNSIREMAMACKALGFKYMVITDHSKSSVIANGLNEERVKAQHEEIDNLNGENPGIRIFKGIESDILPDGSLDYADNILESFDIIIGSVHSSFKMSRDKMTQRVARALKNPFLTILGHPTGRLLLSRRPYEIDIDKVVEAAADSGKIIEINANRYRLDLPWKNAIYGKKLGLKFAVNPDSHRANTLNEVYNGVAIARKAWLGPGDIINCLGEEEFEKQIVHGMRS